MRKPYLKDVTIEKHANGGVKHRVIDTEDFGPVKPCGKCQEVKPVSSFHNDKTSSTGFVTQCKDCACRNSRRTFKTRMQNPEYVLKRRKTYNDLAKVRKRKAVEFMGDKCHDCGFSYPDYIYDFHHLDGKLKTDNPSAVLKRDWEVAKVELLSCVLLCANCHRERHYGPKT